MPARTLIAILATGGAVLASGAVADAATRAPAYPSIAKVSPMRVAIGQTLTITGNGFLKGRRKNTVVFRRPGKRAIFVKADGLSTRRLRLVVPDKLRDVMGRRGGELVASRFQLRVLARRFGRRYTALERSPTILPPVAKAASPAATVSATPVTPAPTPTPSPPPDCDRDGIPDDQDPHDDADLLPDAVEEAIGTDRCNPDTDGDGMEDGWEYSSAVDLNQRSCPTSHADYPEPCPAAMPYPGKRPYTNPLHPDAEIDHDGDGLTAGEEHAAWKRKGAVDPAYRTLTDMWYSDGKQASVDAVPNDGCRGIPAPPPFDGNMIRPEFRTEAGTYPTLFEADGVTVKAEYRVYLLTRDPSDTCLDDGERDEDGDFLTNFEEAHGPLSGPDWWNAATREPIYYLRYTGTDFLDPDSDGDGVLDGLDDQDFDDVLNVEEIVRGRMVVDESGAYTGDHTGLWVDPFNPCLPNPNSRTCRTRLPVDNPGAWRPFFPDMADPGVPRWPLYGTTLYATTPAETWAAPAGVDQTQQPPEHPLPRTP
jgi:hypothetical protein